MIKRFFLDLFLPKSQNTARKRVENSVPKNHSDLSNLAKYIYNIDDDINPQKKEQEEATLPYSSQKPQIAHLSKKLNSKPAPLKTPLDSHQSNHKDVLHDNINKTLQAVSNDITLSQLKKELQTAKLFLDNNNINIAEKILRKAIDKLPKDTLEKLYSNNPKNNDPFSFDKSKQETPKGFSKIDFSELIDDTEEIKKPPITKKAPSKQSQPKESLDKSEDEVDSTLSKDDEIIDYKEELNKLKKKLDKLGGALQQTTTIPESELETQLDTKRVTKDELQTKPPESSPHPVNSVSLPNAKPPSIQDMEEVQNVEKTLEKIDKINQIVQDTKGFIESKERLNNIPPRANKTLKDLLNEADQLVDTQDDEESIGETPLSSSESSTQGQPAMSQMPMGAQPIQGSLELTPPEPKDGPSFTLTYNFSNLPHNFHLSQNHSIFDYSFYKYKSMLETAEKLTKKKQLAKAMNYYKTIIQQDIPIEMQFMIEKNIKDISEYMSKFLFNE